MTPVVLALDVSNLVARAYHVAEAGASHSVLGLARHGLRRMTRTLIDDSDPLRLIAAIDSGAGWRHRAYREYKGKRGEKAEEWRALAREAPELLASEFGFEVYASDDHEADDVLATIADQLLPYRTRTLIVSGDRDLFSLACSTGRTSGTYVMRSENGPYRVYGPEEVQACKKTGVPPLRVPLFKALAGDSSDNLPGVPGFGPVTARRLARTHRSAQRLWDARDTLVGSERTKLEKAGLDHLLLMESLCTLNTRAPLRRVS